MSDTTSGFAPSGGFLSDPFTAAMLGMSAGFANAAMPSRLPVPLGAAIGMGSQGFMQGGFGAQKYGLGQEQLRAAQMQNALTQAMMPSQLAMAHQAQQFLGGGAPMGVPGGIPGVTAESASAGNGGGGASPNINGGYLFSPQEQAFWARWAMMRNQDRSGAALVSGLNHMGEGYAMGPNGTAFPVPGGAKDPGVIATNAAAEGYGKMGPEIATAAGKAGYEPPVPITIPDGQGGFRQIMVPRNQLPTVMAQLGAGGAPSAPSGQMPPAPALPPELQPFGATAQRIQQGENGTGNPGAKNPNSSATGNGQFINSTWLNEFQQHFPQLAAQMTPQQVLALRADPGWSNYMTAAYARDNAQVLQQAGFDASPVNLALAHRFGPDGALRILRLNQTAPTTPMRLAFGDEVLRANPDLAGLKIGNVVGGAQQRMQGIALGQPYQVAGAGAAVPSPAPAAAPSLTPSSHNDEQFGGAPAAAPAPMPAGTVGGMPVLTPQQQTALDVQKAAQQALITTNRESYEKDREHADEALDHAMASQQAMVGANEQMRLLDSGQFNPGALGQWRMNFAAFAKTFLPPDLAAKMTQVAGMSDPASAQEFHKLSFKAVAQQEHDTVGLRGGAQMTKMFQQANPGIELLPDADRRMVNLQRVIAQEGIDYNRGLIGFINQNGAVYRKSGQYRPSQEYDQQWADQRNPQVYAAAASALNGDDLRDVEKRYGLTKEEASRVTGVIRAIDPTARVKLGNQFYPVSAPQ